MNSSQVSICIPTFNAALWISECLQSALVQTYQPLEILVVDDASTDETVELVRSFKDERIRIVVNKRNVGLGANWNRCIELSNGEFIKFLFQDDVLYPDCVQKMARLLQDNSRVGLVFAPRDIIVEGDTEEKLTDEWVRGCSNLHMKFVSLQEINQGRALFEQYVNGRFRGNWIGEPSSLMIRRECFTQLGLFDESLFQICDIEMWLRILFYYEIGFLDETLSAFRFHRRSASHAIISGHRNKLDYLKLLGRLIDREEIKKEYPEIARLRRSESFRVVVRSVIPLRLRLALRSFFTGGMKDGQVETPV